MSKKRGCDIGNISHHGIRNSVTVELDEIGQIVLPVHSAGRLCGKDDLVGAFHFVSSQIAR